MPDKCSYTGFPHREWTFNYRYGGASLFVVGGDPSLFDFSAELTGWFHRGCVGQSRDPQSLPISPHWLQMWALPEMSRIPRP